MEYHLELDPSKVLTCTHEGEQYMESWEWVKGYRYIYKISTFGRILSVKFNKHKILKPYYKGNGYLAIALWFNGNRSKKYIHLLSASNFLNHTPNGNKHLVVDHFDNVKTNNFYLNLKLITNRENIIKGFKLKRDSGTKIV